MEFVAVMEIKYGKKLIQELCFQYESFTTLGRYEDNSIQRIAEWNFILLGLIKSFGQS